MLKKDWSIKSEILKRVQKESEAETVIDYMPPTPKYVKTKLKMTETFKSAFGSLIGKLLL